MTIEVWQQAPSRRNRRGNAQGHDQRKSSTSNRQSQRHATSTQSIQAQLGSLHVLNEIFLARPLSEQERSIQRQRERIQQQWSAR